MKVLTCVDSLSGNTIRMVLSYKEMWAIVTSPAMKIIWMIRNGRTTEEIKTRWPQLISLRDDGGSRYKYCVSTRDPQLKIHVCPVEFIVNLQKWHNGVPYDWFCMTFDNFEKLCTDDLTESFAALSI
jgi:hypothetical protein